MTNKNARVDNEFQVTSNTIPSITATLVGTQVAFQLGCLFLATMTPFSHTWQESTLAYISSGAFAAVAYALVTWCLFWTVTKLHPSRFVALSIGALMPALLMALAAVITSSMIGDSQNYIETIIPFGILLTPIFAWCGIVGTITSTLINRHPVAQVTLAILCTILPLLGFRLPT